MKLALSRYTVGLLRSLASGAFIETRRAGYVLCEPNRPTPRFARAETVHSLQYRGLIETVHVDDRSLLLLSGTGRTALEGQR